MIYAKKINKMPKFYMIFVRKIFFPNFFWGGGASAPSPDSYAYGTQFENSLQLVKCAEQHAYPAKGHHCQSFSAVTVVNWVSYIVLMLILV